MLLLQYYLVPGIKKLKKHLISQYMVEYIISSTLKLLVVDENTPQVSYMC